MPVAVSSTDVENFRHSLYTDTEVKNDSINRCQWCGIWTPIPERQNFITASEETSSTSLYVGLENKLEAVDSVVDRLLEACLCQWRPLVDANLVIEDLPNCSAIATGCSVAAEASEHCRNLHCEPGLKKYCFKRSHLLPVEDPNPITSRSDHMPGLPNSPQYSTDKSTGECKCQ